MHIIKKILSVMSVTLLMIFSSVLPVSAHVVVRPNEVLSASYQTFTVSAPNEKDVAYTTIKLLIPDSIKSVTPTAKPGWTIKVDKTGDGEAAKATAITWSEGNVPGGQRDDFTFSAKTPDAATELTWKAYQTYADGTTVAWDQKAESGHGESTTSGPYSTTKVVSENATDQALAQADAAANSAKATARTSLYLAVAALAITLGLLARSTKK